MLQMERGSHFRFSHINSSWNIYVKVNLKSYHHCAQQNKDCYERIESTRWLFCHNILNQSLYNTKAYDLNSVLIEWKLGQFLWQTMLVTFLTLINKYLEINENSRIQKQTPNILSLPKTSRKEDFSYWAKKIISY